MGPWFAVDPPRRFNRCFAARSRVLHRMVLWEQLSISSLSGLAPAAPFAPLPPGVGVHCRRCYCLFKFTQEPLKEPQGPLVRLPTLKTSKSLKIHYWRPSLRRFHTEQDGGALYFAGGYMIVWLYEKLTWLPCGARGGYIAGLLSDGLVIEVYQTDACRTVPSEVNMLLL